MSLTSFISGYTFTGSLTNHATRKKLKMKKLFITATAILGILSFTSCSKQQQAILSENVTVDFSGIQAEENAIVTFSRGLTEYSFNMRDGLVQSQQIPTDVQYTISVELTSHEQNTGCRYIMRSEYSDITIKAVTNTLSVEQPQELANEYTFEISCR